MVTPIWRRSLCRTNLDEFFVQVPNCSHILEIEAGDVGIGALRPTWLGSVFPPNMSAPQPGAQGDQWPDAGTIDNTAFPRLMPTARSSSTCYHQQTKNLLGGVLSSAAGVPAQWRPRCRRPSPQTSPAMVPSLASFAVTGCLSCCFKFNLYRYFC
jgi:hypothetical protein